MNPLIKKVGDIMKREYRDIKTPEELLEFMDTNISYGYLGKDGKIYREGMPDFNDCWYENYILSTTKDILKTGVGNCFDQTEFEREWFIQNGYEIKTFYHMIKLPYPNDYSTHSFLTYKKGGKWYYFEHSWSALKGIHKFNTLEELLKFEYNENYKELRKQNIKNDELSYFEIREFDRPTPHLSAKEYIDFCIKSKKIDSAN